MATTQETIRRLTIEATDRGLAETTRKMRELGSAHGEVEVKSRGTERATQSVQRALHGLQMRHDDNYRATHLLAKEERTLNAAMSQGLITTQKKNELLERATAWSMRVANAEKARADIMVRQVGLARHELINLGRQAQDVGTMLAMGASPFSILASQGAQVADIFSNTRSSMADVRAQLLGFITPTRLLAVGMVGVAAGAAAAVVSWRSFALALDDTARAAGITTREMAQLQAAASFKGIGATDFSAGIAGFSRSVYEARHNMGGLADVLRANGVPAAKDFNSALESAANLIMRARDDQQRLILLQQMGLPSTMQWARFMSQGAEGVRRAREEAVEFGGATMDEMVRKAREFDEIWNKIWTNSSLLFRSFGGDFIKFVTEHGHWINKLAMIGNPAGFAGVVGRALQRPGATGAMDPTDSPLNTGAGLAIGNNNNNRRETRDANVAREEISRLQQRIGLLGQLAITEMQVLAVQKQVEAARLNGIPITKTEESALLALARARAEATKIQEQATFGIFDSVRAHANLRLEFENLKRTGVVDPNNPTQAAAAWGILNRRLRETAESAQVAASATPQLTRYSLEAVNLQQQLDQVAVAGMRSIETNLADFIMGTKSAADAFKSMANSIIRDIIMLTMRMSITGPLAQALAGGLGGMMGGGGMFPGAAQGIMTRGYHTGGIAGIGGVARYIHPVYFENAPRYHSGGIVGAIRPDEVPAILQRGERIIPRGQTAEAPVVRNEINVQNFSNAQIDVREEEDGRGGKKLNVIVSDMVAGAVSRTGSSANDALLATLGTRRRPRRRGE